MHESLHSFLKLSHLPGQNRGSPQAVQIYFATKDHHRMGDSAGAPRRQLRTTVQCCTFTFQKALKAFELLSDCTEHLLSFPRACLYFRNTFIQFSKHCAGTQNVWGIRLLATKQTSVRADLLFNRNYIHKTQNIHI